VYCPHCDSERIIKRGSHTNQPERNRYECKACGKRFDDLTGTVLAGHHQLLSTWILCLYFMGLNLSNGQIAQELDWNKDDLQDMTEHLRNGIDKKREPIMLSGVVVMSFMLLLDLKGNPRKSRKPHAGDD
jgi:transposase-like protein